MNLSNGFFSNIIGQKQLISENGLLKKMIDNDSYQSFILSGPSGIGKSTLAGKFIEASKKTAYTLNGATTSKSEFFNILKSLTTEVTLILIDEIHRLDRVKQDLLLPFLEKKNIIIIGTTTENTLFSLSDALRSRMLEFKLQDLTTEDLKEHLTKLNDEEFPNKQLSEKIIERLIIASGKDLRKIHQYFYFLIRNYEASELNEEILNELFNQSMQYQETGDTHYNYISALQKSIRASDVNASIYYLGKLLLAGDIDIILRRLLVIAYEDIGLANPSLMYSSNQVIEAFKKVGMPEGRIILGSYVIDLALSPKSTLGHDSINEVLGYIQVNREEPIPEHIKQNQFGKYKYQKEKTFFTNNLPKKIQREKFVKIKENTNNEKKLAKREQYLNELKQSRGGYE